MFLELDIYIYVEETLTKFFCGLMIVTIEKFFYEREKKKRYNRRYIRKNRSRILTIKTEEFFKNLFNIEKNIKSAKI